MPGKGKAMVIHWSKSVRALSSSYWAENKMGSVIRPINFSVCHMFAFPFQSSIPNPNTCPNCSHTPFQHPAIAEEGDERLLLCGRPVLTVLGVSPDLSGSVVLMRQREGGKSIFNKIGKGRIWKKNAAVTVTLSPVRHWDVGFEEAHGLTCDSVA